MFPKRYFAARYFAKRYWPPVSGGAPTPAASVGASLPIGFLAQRGWPDVDRAELDEEELLLAAALL